MLLTNRSQITDIFTPGRFGVPSVKYAFGNFSFCARESNTRDQTLPAKERLV